VGVPVRNVQLHRSRCYTYFNATPSFLGLQIHQFYSEVERERHHERACGFYASSPKMLTRMVREIRRSMPRHRPVPNHAVDRAWAGGDEDMSLGSCGDRRTRDCGGSCRRRVEWTLVYYSEWETTLRVEREWRIFSPGSLPSQEPGEPPQLSRCYPVRTNYKQGFSETSS
jgi:hypothetical protein